MTEAHGGDTGNSLDETDEAQLASALAHEARNRAFIGPMTPEQREAPSREAMAVYARAGKKTELAEALEAGTVLRVDPAEVEDLARFFDAKADHLIERSWKVEELSQVEPPGDDPVSIQTALIFSQVATDPSTGYVENYFKLAELFRGTAAELRASAQRTRTDDENAANDFRGSDFA